MGDLPWVRKSSTDSVLGLFWCRRESSNALEWRGFDLSINSGVLGCFHGGIYFRTFHVWQLNSVIKVFGQIAIKIFNSFLALKRNNESAKVNILTLLLLFFRPCAKVYGAEFVLITGGAFRKGLLPSTCPTSKDVFASSWGDR